MIDEKKLCTITGASGYVGRKIRDHFTKNGWTVYELRRTFQTSESRFLVPYSLEEELKPEVLRALENSSLLIHCAYDFGLVDPRKIWEVNVNGSLRLLDAAKSKGVKRVVVISTMSAFDGCKSVYGRTKLAIETEARRADAVIIRPGLVFGRRSGGLMGALERIVSLSKIVPLIGRGDQILHLAHEEDLCRLVFKLCTEKSVTIGKEIIGASEKGKTFRNVLEVLASARKKTLVFVPLSANLVTATLKCIEMTHLQIGVRSDSVVSLMNLDPNPSFELTKQMGIDFREFNLAAVTS